MESTTLLEHWKAEVKEIAARAEAEHRDLTVLERAKVSEILERLHKIKMDREISAVVDGDADPTRPAGDTGSDLYSAIKTAGYERQVHPVAEVPVTAALSMRVKAGTYSGDFATDPGVADLEPSPELGADRRLYPRLRVQPIGSDITSVQSYRQSSRTLANAALMVRDVDDVSEKPSTNTVSELLAAQVQQIATISKGTPNVLLENTGFRSWVANDLSQAYREAVDTHVVSEISGAVTTTSTGGANVYEEVLYAQAAVAAEGYSASLLVVSANDALAIALLQLTGGDSYAFSQTAPTMIVTPSVADGAGFVLDPAAAGTLYLSPARFEVFEENAGQTNSSTARFESHGVFVVQRPAAIALLSGGS